MSHDLAAELFGHFDELVTKAKAGDLLALSRLRNVLMAHINSDTPEGVLEIAAFVRKRVPAVLGDASS